MESAKAMTTVDDFRDALMLALDECHASGERITVLSTFVEDPKRLVDVPVVDVQPSKFRVKRVGDDAGKWFAVNHVLGIRRASGELVASAEGALYWARIEAGRKQRSDWKADIADTSKTPDVRKAPWGVRTKVSGDWTKMPGPPGSNRTMVLATIRSAGASAQVNVSDQLAATRLCSLVETSFWELAHTWATSQFFWPEWDQTHPDQRVPEAHASAVFRWATTVPADLFNAYIAKGQERYRLFVPHPADITDANARALQRIGLCWPAADAPIEILLELATSRDVRCVLKARGQKAPNLVQAIALLREIAKSEPEAIRREMGATPRLVGKHILGSPAGLTWSEWHAFRRWFTWMARDLQVLLRS